MCAVYALARRIDDIADGELAPATKIAELALLRKTRKNHDDSSDPVLVAVADSTRRFPVPLEAFSELIHGVQMDVDGVCYRHFGELVVYCRRVAGTIGRLCLSIFGPVTGATSRYADQLGIALQQNNVCATFARIFWPGGSTCRATSWSGSVCAFR